MSLPTLLAIPMVVHEPGPHPQLVVVGLADPIANPTFGCPHDLVELGAPLVGPIRF